MENLVSETEAKVSGPTITKFLLGDTKNVLLNVGGEKHEVSFPILNKFPNSRLGKLSFTPLDSIVQNNICDDYNLDKKEYYFGRHPKTFRSILSFHYTGKLHISNGICPIAFTDEMKYWEIDESSLDTCCQLKYYQIMQEIKEEQEILTKNVCTEEESFGRSKCARLRKYIWNLFEQPDSSIPGKILNFVNMIFILICAFILPLTFTHRIGDVPLHKLNGKRDACAWAIIVINSSFIAEYIVRFLVAPNKCKFLKNLLNLMDLLANILVCIIPVIGDDSLIFMYLIVVILRVLKFARHSTAFQAFLFALGNSYKEMGKLLLLLVMAVLILSRMLYYAEKHPYRYKYINTFPKAYWWTAVTMNVVGVGEMYFDTALGKLLMLCCGICGLLLTGLPIPIIVDRFTTYLEGEKRRLKVLNWFKSLKKNDLQKEPNTMKMLGQMLKTKTDVVGTMAINMCIPNSDFTRIWELAKLSCKPLICVGGSRYELTWNMLNRFPNTRLGKISCAVNCETLSQFCDGYSINELKTVFYFQRDSRAFVTILSFYFTGKFHVIEDNICPKELQAEMDYWMIDDTLMESCCYNKYLSKKEQIFRETKEIEDLSRKIDQEDYFGNSIFSKSRKFIWDMIEKRSSTFTGLVFGLISSAITMLSVVTLTARTIPDWNSLLENSQTINITETCCIAWFGMEYTLRFLASPNKRHVLVNFMNSLDLLIVVLYTFGILIEEIVALSDYAIIAIECCAVLRILRLLRLLKLGKHSPAIEALAFTLKSSKNELGVLTFFILVCVFFFSTVAVLYELESGGLPGYWFNEDIAETFWWALITMRTVAMDGKLHTFTLAGKFIGFLCGIFGLLFLVLPIPIIGNNFVEFYKKKEGEKKKQGV